MILEMFFMNLWEFNKKGKKKSINAQNIVNAFAYMNLRNGFTERIQTGFAGRNEIFVYVLVLNTEY